MIYRLRHGIIGPLAVIWLTATVASVVMGAVAWSRFSRSIDAAAASSFASQMYQLFSVLQDAEASQRGYLLTGNPAYRDAFTKADRTFAEKFQQLAALARHEPVRQTEI